MVFVWYWKYSGVGNNWFQLPRWKLTKVEGNERSHWKWKMTDTFSCNFVKSCEEGMWIEPMWIDQLWIELETSFCCKEEKCVDSVVVRNIMLWEGTLVGSFLWFLWSRRKVRRASVESGERKVLSDIDCQENRQVGILECFSHGGYVVICQRQVKII